MDQWKGKVAIVAGSSVGIGASIVKALANSGMIVIGLARRAEAIEEYASTITGCGKVYGKKCDVTNECEVKEAFQWVREQFGGCDVFINNAGMIKAQFLLESDSSDFKNIFDLNILAACICIREAAKDMRERRVKGHIIIMNSILGHRIPDVPCPLFSVYPASKHALTGLAQTVRAELKFHKTNIKLTSLSPGMVDTDFLDVYKSYNPLPKLKADDVAEAVKYILGTPDHVQVEELIVQAMYRHDDSVTE